MSCGRRVKILQLVQTLDPEAGGVARAVTSLSTAIEGRGVDVEIVTLDDAASPWLSALSVPVHPLGVGLTSYRYSTKLLPWLRANRRRFDAVIVNGLWQYLGFAAWRAFARTNTAYFVFPHGMLDPWFKVTFPLKHLKKWLYWPWADYRLLRDARAVVFTSDEERIQARESFWLYRCRERVVPLGIEPVHGDPEIFLAKFPSLRGKPFLLFLGRIHPKKGCDLLINAAAAAGLDVVIAGPDQIGWRAELEKRATARVSFVGMIEGEMKSSALAAADAFVLPSHQENFGLAVVEALSAGLPVLISNRVNIWREIEEDRAGYVDTDDLDGTKRMIARWLGTSAADREQMRQNARTSFEQRFSAERAAESLLSVIHE
jgi:glycosyltransferase involved in cell wall biosynthesis